MLTLVGSAAYLVAKASLLHDRFLAAMAGGRGDLDWAAVALNVAEEGEGIGQGSGRTLKPSDGIMIGRSTEQRAARCNPADRNR